MEKVTDSSFSLKRYYPAKAEYGAAIIPEFTRPSPNLERYTVDDFNNVPERTLIDLADGSQMSVYEIMPRTDYDETRTIVRIMDFANGIAPHSYAAAIAIAELLGHRVIVVPQNDISLSHKERQFVKFGDLTPLSRKQAEGLESIISDDEDITLYGNSFGGQLVPSVSKEINENGVKQVDKIVAIEPPNTYERSRVQLLRDFSAEGNSEWAEAVRQSKWKALIDLLGVADTDSSKYMKSDNTQFALHAFTLSNLAIIGAMSQQSFAEDIRAASAYLPASGSVVVAKAFGSRILSGFGLEDAIDHARPIYERSRKSLVAYVIETELGQIPTGHAIGNNPMVAASVIARA